MNSIAILAPKIDSSLKIKKVLLKSKTKFILLLNGNMYPMCNKASKMIRKKKIIMNLLQLNNDQNYLSMKILLRRLIRKIPKFKLYQLKKICLLVE